MLLTVCLFFLILRYSVVYINSFVILASLLCPALINFLIKSKGPTEYWQREIMANYQAVLCSRLPLF